MFHPNSILRRLKVGRSNCSNWSNSKVVSHVSNTIPECTAMHYKSILLHIKTDIQVNYIEFTNLFWFIHVSVLFFSHSNMVKSNSYWNNYESILSKLGLHKTWLNLNLCWTLLLFNRKSLIHVAQKLAT